jgi:hypothetical protein
MNTYTLIQSIIILIYDYYGMIICTIITPMLIFAPLPCIELHILPVWPYFDYKNQHANLARVMHN